MESLVDILVEEWDSCKDMIPKRDRIETNKVIIFSYFIPYINILNKNFKKKNANFEENNANFEENIYELSNSKKDTYHNEINCESCKNEAKEYFNQMKNFGWVLYKKNNEINIKLTNRGKDILLAYNKKNHEVTNYYKNFKPEYKLKNKKQAIQQIA